MSRISHALRELQELFPDDPDLIQCYLEVIMAYDAKASSEKIDPDILSELFKGHRLSDLTNDPTDWEQCDDSMWQSLRDVRVVSDDGGATYFIITEDDTTRHISKPKKEKSNG